MDTCKEGIKGDSWILAWRLVNDGAITNVIELMEEVGVMGPDGSRDEFNLGHIAYHMPGRMSSK